MPIQTHEPIWPATRTAVNKSQQPQDPISPEISMWLQNDITRIVLAKLDRLYLTQLQTISNQSNNIGVSDTLLRLTLSKAAILEQIINRIKEGNIQENKSL